eukprot:3074292-Pyramimonas_sp.AAC.1
MENLPVAKRRKASGDSAPIVSLEQIVQARGPCQELFRLASATCGISGQLLRPRSSAQNATRKPTLISA